MFGEKIIFNIRKNCGYLTFVTVICVVAIGAGSWLGVAKRRAKVPRGYEPTNIPGIFVKDRIADLGMISPDRLVDVTFDFFNSSKNTYIVKRVSAACGCATVSLTEHALQPNNSFAIPVKMDTSKLGGNAFKKGVLIELTREGQKQIWKDVFHLKGTIDRSGTFTVWPGILDYGDVVLGESTYKTIYFKADEALLKVLPSVIKIEHPPEVLNLPNVEYSHNIRFKSVEVRLAISNEAVTGIFESSITIQIDGPPPRRMVIPVLARVIDEVTVSPERIYMTVSNQNNQDSVDLMLCSINGRKPSVKTISSSLPVRWIIRKESTPKDTLIITIKPDKDAHQDKSLCGDIQIEMSNGTRHILPIVLVPLNFGSKAEKNPAGGQMTKLKICEIFRSNT